MTTDEELLSASMQRRNSVVFLANNALAYFVAPVFYVGVLHAAILSSLGASDTVANLPAAVYLWVTPAPVLIAWLWPSPQLMRPILATALVLMGAAGVFVALVIVAAPPSWLIPTLVAHAAIIGVANGVRQMCLWELIGRGLTPQRRAWTLAWTFGIGPLFAVIGSCASQMILSGNFLDVIQVPQMSTPWNYVTLFGATGPAMLLSAALVGLASVPPQPESVPQPRAAGALSGLRQYFFQPRILIAAIAFLLTYGGLTVMNNLSLYARDAIGRPPEEYAGLQLALRFGCKCLAGFALGWLVARIHAKASLLATTAICLAGIGWALVVPGVWYLLSFGLLGAGELFYVYYMNYIVGSSPPERIRENTAYTNLIAATVGFMPLVYGVVSDHYGLRASFLVAIILFAAAIMIVCLGLPRHPTVSKPSLVDGETSDLPQ